MRSRCRHRRVRCGIAPPCRLLHGLCGGLPGRFCGIACRGHAAGRCSRLACLPAIRDRGLRGGRADSRGRCIRVGAAAVRAFPCLRIGRGAVIRHGIERIDDEILLV